ELMVLGSLHSVRIIGNNAWAPVFRNSKPLVPHVIEIFDKLQRPCGLILIVSVRKFCGPYTITVNAEDISLYLPPSINITLGLGISQPSCNCVGNQNLWIFLLNHVIEPVLCRNNVLE